MTTEILHQSRPSTRNVTQRELDELYAAAYADEPFVRVAGRGSVDQARPAATTCSSTSGWTSARTDRRRRSASRTTSSRAPQPGVQAFTPRPRPAGTAGLEQYRRRAKRLRCHEHDRHHPGSSSRGRRRSSIRRAARLICRPASMPVGWRPRSRPLAGRTSPSPSRREVRRPWPPCSRRTRSRPHPFAGRAPISSPRPGMRGRFGWAEAVVSTSGSANVRPVRPATPMGLRSGASSPTLGIDETRVLHLSTEVIGTRLPLEGRGRSRSARAATDG